MNKAAQQAVKDAGLSPGTIGVNANSEMPYSCCMLLIGLSCVSGHCWRLHCFFCRDRRRGCCGDVHLKEEGRKPVLRVIVCSFLVVLVTFTQDEDTRRYVDSVVSSYLPMEDENGNDDEEEDSGLQEKEATATL